MIQWRAPLRVRNNLTWIKLIPLSQPQEEGAAMEATDYFRGQARVCRQLADDMGASLERRGLLQLARHYDGEAKRAAAERGPSAPSEGRAAASI
jgi:hypothetical protein